MHTINIYVFTILSVKGIHLLMISNPNILAHFDCPTNIGDHLTWWYQLRPKTYPQHCLQILHSPDSFDISAECFMRRLIPLNFSFYIRSVAEVASSTLNSSRLNSVHKSCPSILATSFKQLFQRNCNDETLPCQRFYPHSWIVKYSSSKGHAHMDENEMDYIRNNALHVFIMTGNQSQYFIKELLSDQSILVGNINKNEIDSFVETFRIHPLFRNGIIADGVDRRNTFRISFLSVSLM